MTKYYSKFILFFLPILLILLSGCSGQNIAPSNKAENNTTDCAKFSGTFGEEVYMASPDAKTCIDNGCEIKSTKCYEGIPGALDTGWCEFDCVEKK